MQLHVLISSMSISTLRPTVIGSALVGFLVAFITAIAAVSAQPARKDVENFWAESKKPSASAAQAVGGYSAGCIAGATALPDSGPGFQLVRPGRKRHFGHPELVDFVRDLAAALVESKKGVLMVGDLGQPRGGPAPSGHSSHQSGLDADIWFWHPKSAEARTLSRKKRHSLSARTIMNTKTGKPTAAWTGKVPTVLKLAAKDKRVARIFVNPLIKKKLCEANANASEAKRAWLAKLRPWWGHNAHFHVRLRCPKDSPNCANQGALPKGDGCSEIDWWLSEKSKKDRGEGRKKYQKSVRTMPELPAGCQTVADDRAK